MGLLLSDAAHLCAEVYRLYMHRYTVWPQNMDESVRYLLTYALLHCEAPRKHADETGQLRDPDDVLVRYISDVGVPVERQSVMLA
jgi:hypothetical protein